MLFDWRGPRAKYHVMLSLSPSRWHVWHDDHAWPRSDQRPSPVLNSRLPRTTAIAAPEGRSAVETTLGVAPPATTCWSTPIASADTFRLMSFATNAKGSLFVTAMPIGFSPFAPSLNIAGARLMYVLAG